MYSNSKFWLSLTVLYILMFSITLMMYHPKEQTSAMKIVERIKVPKIEKTEVPKKKIIPVVVDTIKVDSTIVEIAVDSLEKDSL